MKHLLEEVQKIFEAEQFLAQPEELYRPIDYTLRLGGKRIRPHLLLAANQMFGGKTDDVRHAALAIETFHNFTLLHDDLMDRSPLRRGKPTVYSLWGDNSAILSGDTMFALAWRYLLRRDHPRLRDILNTFNETAIEVCEGQQYDMNFEQRDDVTVPEYLEMIRLKTAVLLAGALKMGALYAQAPDGDIQRLYDFGIHLGLSFQLQDDLLDAYGDTATFGKATGQDIRDNKKTYLYLHALQVASPEQQERLRQLFNNESSDTEAKVREVLDIYGRLNIREAVEKAIADEFDMARKCLAEVRAEEAAKAPLRELLETLFDRKK